MGLRRSLGQKCDLLVAFALGVLAHRIVQSLRSAGENLMSFLWGNEKPSTATATDSAGKEGAVTAPAKPG